MKTRRSLTTTRRPSPTTWAGDATHGRALAEALSAPHGDETTHESLTHPVHTYPARMHPATASRLIQHLLGPRPSAEAVVLDPFCGSGTTLVEARAAGASALGVDLSPLAALLARTKATPLPEGQYKNAQRTAQRIAGEVHAVGRAARRADSETASWWHPTGVDGAARGRKLSRWFAPHVRREIEAIAARIADYETQSGPEVANILWVALSAILVKVSSRTAETDATWVDKRIARGAPLRWWTERVEMLLAGLREIPRAGHTETLVGDARTLPRLVPPASAFCLVTSPPYAGTYDYVDHHRLRFDFFGWPLAPLKSGELAPRRGTSDWPSQLRATLVAAAHALAPHGLAAFVLGDSRSEGPTGAVHFALDDMRAALPPTWQWVASASQARPLWGREADRFGTRGKAEHVILLRRVQA